MISNTYSPVDNTLTTTMTSNINTTVMFPTKAYSPVVVGSTSLTTTGGTPSLNSVNPSMFLRLVLFELSNIMKPRASIIQLFY